MKALVTGATGGLGRNLVERLHRDGHDVVATGRNTEIGKVLTRQGIRFEPADLSDRNRLMALGNGREVIFHCAALSSPWGRRKDFHEANVRGTLHVAQSANANEARLVHVSTPSIYFEYFDKLNISEFDPLPAKMVNRYAATKYEAEEVIKALVHIHGLKAVMLRPRGIFGPYDSVLMPRLIAAAKAGRVPLINGGKAVIDVTYVENVVDAMLLAAKEDHPGWNGQAYNISNGRAIVLKDLIAKAFGALDIPYKTRNVPYWLAKPAAFLMEEAAWLSSKGREPKFTRYTVGVFSFDHTLNITRARNDLGYEPRVGIEEGIARYADWYRSQGNEH